MGVSQLKVTYVDHCGTDLSVVNSARVSFNKWHEELDKTKDPKLIKYLAKHNHISPFNHSFITMHVKAPIFVARQLVKHKFMPWNEVSRRYVDEEPEFYWPVKWRGKSKDKKQGSEDFVENAISSWNQLGIDKGCLSIYNTLLDKGVAPEQARIVLPLNTYTEWYWSGTLGAWMNMYNLRSKEDTQWETQQIAFMCGEIIQGLFPYSFEALVQEWQDV